MDPAKNDSSYRIQHNFISQITSKILYIIAYLIFFSKLQANVSVGIGAKPSNT